MEGEGGGGGLHEGTPPTHRAPPAPTQGLFIVAHDCVHNCLSPESPALQRAVGAVCLGAFGGISYDTLRRTHLAHHAASGDGADPDMPCGPRGSFVRWFLGFLAAYSTPVTRVFVPAVGGAMLLAGAAPARVLLHWALPLLLSALQMFYFATYLPHRSEAHTSLAKRPRTRSARVPRCLGCWPRGAAPPPPPLRAVARALDLAVSLAACWHNGTYHAEHHAEPRVPFWRMPSFDAAE